MPNKSCLDSTGSLASFGEPERYEDRSASLHPQSRRIIVELAEQTGRQGRSIDMPQVMLVAQTVSQADRATARAGPADQEPRTARQCAVQWKIAERMSR
ncbi:hypothetical protein ACWEO2_03950 [Nocardia sp. NPDC004278]